MSKYTTELRYICESITGLTESKGVNSVNDIIKQAAPLIFSFDFPIYKEEHRLELECKILKRYYTREIGAETYGRWKLFLDERMNSIMDYYNKLYESAELEFNPMVDYKVTRKGSNSSSSRSSGTSRNLYSDTPQGGLSGIEHEKYLTNASKDTSNGEASGNGSYDETVEGLAGGRSPAFLLKEYRNTILNIDNMIVDELNDLFMNIW